MRHGGEQRSAQIADLGDARGVRGFGSQATTLERDARYARELVITWSAAIGNYTYGVEYVFQMNGAIDVNMNATGTTLNQGISASQMVSIAAGWSGAGPAARERPRGRRRGGRARVIHRCG